jgi:hypothetical protein
MSSTASLTTLAALSLSAVACGGTETIADSGSSANVADAVEETLDAGTARMTLTFEHTRSGGFGEEIGDRDIIEGVVDFDEHRIEVTTDVEGFVLDEMAFYLREEGDTEWRRYARDPGPGDEIFPDVSLGRLDPIPLLEYVASIESSFVVGADEDLDGVATTRYSGQGVAEGLMRALLPDSLYEKLPWEMHSASVQHSDVVPCDVWVGDDGLVRQLVLDFPDFSSFVGDLTTLELSDFGADVDIEIPEATEAVEG